jgi:response regulator RpfG family c-di-GMP phosphodiesterase
MKRRFVVTLTLLFILFGAGYSLALHVMSKTSAELDRVLMLQGVEDLRQDLERQIVLSKQALEVSGTVFANNLDEVVVTIRGLESQMNACHNCHHAGASRILIQDGVELVDQYKLGFSRFVTAIGDNALRQNMQIEVARVGERLVNLVRRIRHVATPQLNQRTAATQARIKRSTQVLGAAFIVTFMSALALAWWFTHRATRPVLQLIDAANQIAEGRLGVQIEHRERGSMGKLLEEFNEMSTSLRTQERVVKKRTDEILKTRDMALVTLARLAESRDEETGRHLERIAAYSRCVAAALRDSPYANRINEIFIDQLEKSSPLHDIGKVGIPDDILRKPGRLTDEEFDIMREHTTIGAHTLRSVIDDFDDSTFLEMGMEIAYCHHEKWDGSGYPRQLVGEEIPLSARIVALSDAYDCITTKRVYKPAYDHEDAVRRILKDRGRHFDPVVVDAFLACLGEFDTIRETYREQLEDRSEGAGTSPAKIVPLRSSF